MKRRYFKKKNLKRAKDKATFLEGYGYRTKIQKMVNNLGYYVYAEDKTEKRTVFVDGPGPYLQSTIKKQFYGAFEEKCDT
ncbi:hypothetical protein BK128_21370 [Viridibacillus sp. FSL H7-0596]|uniref:hypothetical protein n=1 Tax=Viridibacillus sp. FSL H7-0596 TaxID=1928923 RepID=UPI00096D4B5E|nr:hypothetical protein [Viridibacillus sp. FSL H7-0596]OMC81823.1 hypothetical protein BK128_21370 [Viridibacillus sp. FSL H7-0596]